MDMFLSKANLMNNLILLVKIFITFAGNQIILMEFYCYIIGSDNKT